MSGETSTIDLYLGSDIGLWALSKTPGNQIGHVVTQDREIADKARAKGIEVILGNANEACFGQAHIGFSVHYPYIIKPGLISRYQKMYNLHPGYLPWGKGFYPVFWALWEDTPAGATLHEITEGVDEGPIVDQIQVEYTPYDTGYSLFQRVRAAEKRLFMEYFPKLMQGKHLPARQQREQGTYHTKQEFFTLKRPQNWRDMQADKLVRLIRCLSFPGFTGLEVSIGGEYFSLSAQLVTKV